MSTTTLQSLEQEVQRLSREVDELKSLVLGARTASAAAAQAAAQAAVAAAHVAAVAAGTAEEEVTPELVAVISASIAVLLGQGTTIKRVKFIRTESNAWQEVGRPASFRSAPRY